MTWLKWVFAISLMSSICSPAVAEGIKITTWNIANLHHETGVALRNGSVARENIDFQRLSEVGALLNADIIALQEIGSPRALARVFDRSKYHLIVSDRYSAGDENKPPEERDIFTAFAISKERFPSLPSVETVGAFSLSHIELNHDGTAASIRPTRSAMHIEFELDGEVISILNVHLKSSCHQYPLKDVEDQNFFNSQPFGSRFDCRTLKAQLSLLENWIEVQSALDKRVIVAGDFNRRLNSAYRNPTRHEDFWAELNDGQPNHLKLRKGPEGLDSVCWPKHEDRFVEHIDLVIADSELFAKYPQSGFEKIGLGYDDAEEYAERKRQRLSDHCPVTLTLSD